MPEQSTFSNREFLNQHHQQQHHQQQHQQHQQHNLLSQQEIIQKYLLVSFFDLLKCEIIQ